MVLVYAIPLKNPLLIGIRLAKIVIWFLFNVLVSVNRQNRASKIKWNIYNVKIADFRHF